VRETSNKDQRAKVLVSRDDYSIRELGGGKKNLVGRGKRDLTSYLGDIVSLRFEMKSEPALDVLVDE
jgi:hypothetical protein